MTRREAREQAFFLVFEAAFGQQDAEERILLAKEARELADDPFCNRLATGTIARFTELDQLIEQHAAKWKTSRISKISLAILRLALYEMEFEDAIPESVSINEAVELAKKYGGDEDPSFVNGILGAVSRARKKEE